MPRLLMVSVVLSLAAPPLAAQLRWSTHSLAYRPSARADHVMAFDEARSRVVLFGGTSARNGTLLPLDDTWEWDGSSWAAVVTPTRPSGGGAALMTYDPTSRRVLLARPGAAVWTFDGRDWQASGTVPPARATALVADARRGVLLMVTDLGAVFELRQGASGPEWRLVPATGGPSLVSHATFDAARGVTVVVDPRLRDGTTFEWDGTTWMRAATDAFPFRTIDAVAYDRTRQRMVVSTDYGLFERAGARWLALPNPSAPAGCARLFGAFAHDAARGELVLFGGTCGFSATFLDDTQTMAPAARPSARAFGTPCASAAGSPRIDLAGLPLLGNPDVALRASGLVAGGPGAVLLGTPSNVPIAGCTVWVAPAVVAPIVGDAHGQASVALPLPYDPRLRLVGFAAQVVAWTPNLTALAASPGLAFTIGD